jgi:hypothetical protein
MKNIKAFWLEIQAFRHYNTNFCRKIVPFARIFGDMFVTSY